MGKYRGLNITGGLSANFRKIKVTIVKFQYKKLTSSLSSKKVSGSKK